MKNLFKIALLACFAVVMYSCETQGVNEGNFNENPEDGFVFFNSGANEALIFKEEIVENDMSSITIPVNVSLPINRTDLLVNYSINDVEGNSDPLIVGTSDLVFRGGTNSQQTIELTLDVGAVAADIFTLNIFDIVLTGTNRSSVNVGVDPGENFPASFRVTLSPPCFTPVIDGTFDFVSSNLQSGPGGGCPDGDGAASGSVTWTALGDDIYASTDFSFGLFDACWGDTPAAGPLLVMVCNELSVAGVDQYGDTYEYLITNISGPNMTIEWSNSYGDGGTVVLTRTDGTDWPELALAE